MINVEVRFRTAANDRPAAIRCLTAEAPQMRRMSGNQSVQILVAPDHSEDIILLHRWDDLDSLNAYRDSPLFAAISHVLRPMMVNQPSTEVYEAQLVT